MPRIVTSYLLLLVITTNACAQTLPVDRDIGPGSHAGTIACKTEDAMVMLMKASPALTTNEQVLDRLIKSGDCLIMSRGWAVLLAEDPPLDQQEDHASKWTVRTPDGVVHMWGTPFGGD
ncbi:hypothetical protein EO087_13955 [Dyella sp. M7H15-1]|uniref:hypothetical protein n=1 Tax=Dyella sp. M7H15-1 TaxID=2501295 RepID=UPI00100505FC|nr:hypothetical protein [Dyella sp. M7H15-1]QAU24960.1 hypothetical protein EO087_13955 [Dyella sp. M7H15-1]